MTRSALLAALKRIAADLTEPSGEREARISSAALGVGMLLAQLERDASQTFPVDLPPDPTARIIEALERAGPDGLSLNQLRRQVFGGHIRAAEVRRLMKDLRDSGRVTSQRREGRGRPGTIFFLTGNHLKGDQR